MMEAMVVRRWVVHCCRRKVRVAGHVLMMLDDDDDSYTAATETEEAMITKEQLGHTALGRHLHNTKRKLVFITLHHKPPHVWQ